MIGYGAELSAAWADHLAPRKPDALTMVSTFAGCGGSSLGYSMAGFRELLAVEWDDHAAACFARNFPDVPLFHGDIAKLDPARLDLAPGALDVLDGSPPCQGFSFAGRRDSDDSRNGLFREYVRLLEAWRPRMFVMENVPGLVAGKMAPIFAEIMRALRVAGPGYQTVARVMSTERFRVPQTRRRLVIIGARSDLDVVPEHPRARSRPLTARDAFADMPDPGQTVPLKGQKLPRLAPLIRPGERGADALATRGRKANAYDLSRLHWGKPARTLCKSFYQSGYGGFLHPDESRFLGTRELMRIQSFPDEYDWDESSYIEIHNRLGNSVPPMFMRAVAETIADTLNHI